MTKISVKNIKGEVVKDITLESKIWNIEVNDDALKKMIRLQLDSMRQGTRKTKTRSEVSGGGRKPWKQKGTGRARQGSIRAVQWRGGGVAFGVSPRNFTFKINKKERVLALKTALTYKNTEKSVVVLDNIKLETLKTMTFSDLDFLKNLDETFLYIKENYDFFVSNTKWCPSVRQKHVLDVLEKTNNDILNNSDIKTKNNLFLQLYDDFYWGVYDYFDDYGNKNEELSKEEIDLIFSVLKTFLKK